MDWQALLMATPTSGIDANAASAGALTKRGSTLLRRWDTPFEIRSTAGIFAQRSDGPADAEPVKVSNVAIRPPVVLPGREQ